MSLNRREFIKFTSKTIALGAVSNLGIPSSLEASTGPSFNDYKAIVCVMLSGGNDSLNMFVPSGDDSEKGWSKYASIRGDLAVANNDLLSSLNSLNPYNDGDDNEKSYTKGFYKHASIDGLATNSIMPELAKLIENNKVAVVANMGTLVEPTNKFQYKNKLVEIPKFVFAHNHQVKIMYNGTADSLQTLGWAGRLADKWQGVNNNHPYGMNISYSGKPYLFNAFKTEPLVLSSGAPIAYKGVNTTYGTSTARGELYKTLHETPNPNPLMRLYNSLIGTSFSLVDQLASDWESSYTFTSTNDYGKPLFDVPTKSELNLSEDLKDGFIKELHAIAKMIKIGKDSGLKRQVFSVTLGGFDTHGSQALSHSKLLRTLSLGMGDFQAAIDELGMSDEVTTFNLSDFSRTVGVNGSGTDHAWGGHYFVMGGAVNSGLYGTLPDLNLDGSDDASKKGRLIPTTALDQYLGTILKWYGVDSTTMNTLLPNLKNFSESDLGFLS